jgi:hypothetical protein
MLIVISGSEESALNQKTKEILEKREWKEKGVLYHDAPTVDALQESAVSQDLFGNTPAHVFRELEDAVYEFLFENIDLFAKSPNILIAQVAKVLKKQKDICAKAGVEMFEVKKTEVREMPSFVLADAFLRRDKKAAFVALHDELATKPPEEVHGGLWYQMKNMALILSGATEEESGIHPFVYKKIKSASKAFSKKECDGILKELLEMNHKAHRGEVDFEIALEQFVLRFTK